MADASEKKAVASVFRKVNEKKRDNSMSDLALETWSLSKKFPAGRVVHEVSLTVPGGAIFALLGAGGAGKSTFLKLIMGLTVPSSGGGFCLGFDISTKGIQIREKAAYIAQDTGYYGYMTVEQLLNFRRGFYSYWDEKVQERVLSRFQLPLEVKVKKLSYDHKRFLGLVLALPSLPDLLIMDEPVAGLNQVKRDLFYQVMMEETRFRGTTVIISSDRLEDVEGIATQGVLLRKGRLQRQISSGALQVQEKEIRIVFKDEPPPDFFKVSGVVNFNREDGAYRITVTHGLEEVWRSCASRPYHDMELVKGCPEGLEELFPFLKGGRKVDPPDSLS